MQGLRHIMADYAGRAGRSERESASPSRHYSAWARRVAAITNFRPSIAELEQLRAQTRPDEPALTQGPRTAGHGLATEIVVRRLIGWHMFSQT